MSSKISQLPSASSASNLDVIPIVQGGQTKQVDIPKLLAAANCAPGTDTQIMRNIGGAIAANAALSFDPATARFVAVKDVVGVTFTGSCWLIGRESEASNTYCIAIGYQCRATQAACIAIGEQCTATQANATAIGFSNNATATYASAVGVSCNATGHGSFACGLSATASRPGEFVHSSGRDNSQSSEMDLYIALNGVAGNLVDALGNEFEFDTLSAGRMTIELTMVTVAGSAKLGSAMWTLQFNCQAGPALTITTPKLVSDAAEQPSTVAAGGGGFWAVTISAVGGTRKMRIAANPGTDNVRVYARLRWSRIGNL